MILLAEILQVIAYFIFIFITVVYIRQIYRLKKQRELSHFEKSMQFIVILGFWFLTISIVIFRFAN